MFAFHWISLVLFNFYLISTDFPRWFPLLFSRTVIDFHVWSLFLFVFSWFSWILIVFSLVFIALYWFALVLNAFHWLSHCFSNSHGFPLILFKLYLISIDFRWFSLLSIVIWNTHWFSLYFIVSRCSIDVHCFAVLFNGLRCILLICIDSHRLPFIFIDWFGVLWFPWIFIASL